MGFGFGKLLPTQLGSVIVINRRITMIRLSHLSFFAVVLSLGFSAVGCRRKPVHPTPIPGYTAVPAPGGESDTAGMIRNNGSGNNVPQGSRLPAGNPSGARDLGTSGQGPGTGLDPNAIAPLSNLENFEGRALDRELFKGNTIYFEFDRATLRKSEMGKLAVVADHLKANPGDALLIEGHCDERGTEEYNRSLGERRALAAREYVVNLGVQADRIRTLSYGEDHPAVDSHDESAWSKNRRCEFGRLLPAPTR